MDKKKFYMTTAIAYTSGKPHIGNTYEIILADAIARFKRAQGYDVFFQTGTDEIHPMTNLFVPQTKIMRNRYRRSSKNCTTREIFTKVPTRDYTVRPVSPSGQSLSWWMASARTVAVK